jgi:high-affinity iron transporter
MLPSLLLTFREGLEAALIVGIIFGILRQLGRHDLRRLAWTAVAAAAALSLALAVALQIAGAEFEGRGEMLFEGTAMLLAVGVLTWMIFWMRRQARFFRARIEAEMRVAIRQGHHWALFSIVFLAVFREGVETALFLTAANVASGDDLSTFVGGVIGLAVAVLIGWAIYRGAARLNVRRFFDVTSVLLLIFAAGLFAHGLHEFEELGWLPALAEEVWNLKPVLSDTSTVGSLLRVLVGYNDDPTLLEVIGYLAYWGVVLVAANWWANRPVVNGRATSSA